MSPEKETYKLGGEEGLGWAPLAAEPFSDEGPDLFTVEELLFCAILLRLVVVGPITPLIFFPLLYLYIHNLKFTK